jgi:hypothetical protein
MSAVPHRSPAEGHPAKYYFAGTPKAGAQLSGLWGWAPAFAGKREGQRCR